VYIFWGGEGVGQKKKRPRFCNKKNGRICPPRKKKNGKGGVEFVCGKGKKKKKKTDWNKGRKALKKRKGKRKLPPQRGRKKKDNLKGKKERFFARGKRLPALEKKGTLKC